jgi:PAS domain S-box-containing protein
MNRAPPWQGEFHHTIKINYIMMNYQNKTKEVLVKELQKLQQEYDSLKTSYAKDITECKKVEASLKQALEWKEEIFEGSRDAIFISDKDSRFVAVNSMACDLTGYSREQLLKMRIPDIHDLPDLRAYKMYHKKILGGKEVLSEAKILRSDGAKIDTEFNNRCLSIAGKLYMHTTARNITVRKKAEETIRILARFPSENPDPVLRVNRNGQLLYANPASYKSLIWKLQIGKKVPSALQKIIAEALKIGVRKIFDTEHNHRVISFNVIPNMEADYANLYGQDITERKMIEEGMRESEERFRRLYQQAPLGYQSLDAEGCFNDVNQAWLDMMGYSHDQVIGRWFGDFLAPQEVDAFRQRFQCFKVTGEVHVDLEMVQRAGSRIIVHIDGKTGHDENGQFKQTHCILHNITERKLAEESLRQSNEKFSKIFKTSPDAITITRFSDGTYLEVNQNFTNTTGFNAEEVLGRSSLPGGVALWTNPEDRNRMMTGLNTCGEVIGMEAPLRMKNGTIRIAQLSARILEINDEKYILTVARDITERKGAEEALQESETRYRELFNNISSGVAIYEVRDNGNDFIFTDFNRAGERIDGDRKKDIIGKSIFEVRPGINKFGLLEVFRRVFETGISEHYPVKFYEDEKLKAWYDNFVYRLPSGEIVAVYDNITERRQDEEMLQKSESKYRNLIEQAPDIIFIVDAEGNLLHVNQTGQKMLGYSEDELHKIKTIDTYPTDEMTIGRRRLKEFRTMRAGETMHFERLMRRKDGTLFPVEINVGALQDGTAHAIIRDITERKQVEEALQQEKENFRHSLDDSPLGVRIATIEGNTIYANKTILDFYGYDSLGEMQKTRLKDRYTPESYARAQKRKHQREHGDFSVTEYEISIVRKNGEIRHLQVYRNEVLWNGARQFQVIYKDITVHKKAEEELRNSKELLEKLNQHLHEVRENERAVISREIHDELGQSLTALKLDLNRMHKYINANPEAVAKLESMIELVSNTIKDVQRISSDLRPGILDELGLISAIEWYCDEFEKRTGIRCHLKLDNSDYDDSQINLTFFRVLQETLTNVIRHAKASSVIIKLHKVIKGATMTIHDNGIGIHEEKIRSNKSFGLISMRERVKQFNGTIDISSKKDYGTKLVIFIPS